MQTSISRLVSILIVTSLVLSWACDEEKEKKSVIGGKGIVRNDFISTGKIPIDYDGIINFKLSFYNARSRVPMVMTKDTLVLKPYKVDTISGNFLFDTGAYGLVIDSMYYKNSAFYYEYLTPIKQAGVGETSAEALAIGNTVHFSLDKLNYRSESNVITNYKKVVGKSTDGLIGYNFFVDQVVQINYKDSYMRILNPSDFKPGDDYIRIPIKDEEYLLIPAELKINKDVTIKGDFLFDTGFLGSVNLTSETAKKYKIENIVPKKMEYSSVNQGLGGKSTGYACRAEFLGFAGQKLKSPIVICSRDTGGALAKGNYVGLLGNHVFERFDMIIDFPGKTLYLKPNENLNEPFIFNKTGFASTDRTDICEGRIVKGIILETDADLNGLKIGDIITHINDKAVTKVTKKEWYEYFLKTGNKIKLLVKRGKQILKINIELKDYL